MDRSKEMTRILSEVERTVAELAIGAAGQVDDATIANIENSLRTIKGRASKRSSVTEQRVELQASSILTGLSNLERMAEAVLDNPAIARMGLENPSLFCETYGLPMTEPVVAAVVPLLNFVVDLEFLPITILPDLTSEALKWLAKILLKEGEEATGKAIAKAVAKKAVVYVGGIAVTIAIEKALEGIWAKLYTGKEAWDQRLLKRAVRGVSLRQRVEELRERLKDMSNPDERKAAEGLLSDVEKALNEGDRQVVKESEDVKAEDYDDAKADEKGADKAYDSAEKSLIDAQTKVGR